jgi:hypothetical protein
MASATNPLAWARRAASICASRPGPAASTLGHETPPHRRAIGVAEKRAGLGRLSPRQPDRRRGRPFLSEHLLQSRDGGGDARKHRVPVFGIMDRGRQHLGERQAAMVAQHQHPGVEGPGRDRRQKARARDDVEPFGPVVRRPSRRRRRALSAEHQRRVRARGHGRARAPRPTGRSDAAPPRSGRNPPPRPHPPPCRPPPASSCPPGWPANGWWRPCRRSPEARAGW